MVRLPARFDQGWWRGQDSNLRSPSGRQIYSLVALTTHPPLQAKKSSHITRSRRNRGRPIYLPTFVPDPTPLGTVLTESMFQEPQRGVEPLTCQLQIDCASVAPQGHRGPWPRTKRIFALHQKKAPHSWGHFVTKNPIELYKLAVRKSIRFTPRVGEFRRPHSRSPSP